MSAEVECEWDEYPEPLWDPLRSEVQLLVIDYFARADAMMEATEGSVE